MVPVRTSSNVSATRTRVAALTVAGLAVAYGVLSVWYFYEDFFKFLEAGAFVTADRTGWLIPLDHPIYAATILSPWRLLGASLAVALLGASAASLWHGRPRARALTLLTLWGVLLPQTFWYAEFVVDWHQSAFLGEIFLIGLIVALVPTMLLYAGKHTLVSWNPSPARTRLLGMTIALAWVAFAASRFLDQSYQVDSATAYLSALLAIPLAILAVQGLFHLRTWALWVGVVASLGLAVVPLAVSWSLFFPHGGYFDQIYIATMGCGMTVAMATMLPVVLVWSLGAPYLHAFLRRVRG